MMGQKRIEYKSITNVTTKPFLHKLYKNIYGGNIILYLYSIYY